jgi:hypothetical protein
MFITPSYGLFSTCRGDKYTVLIQYCTIYHNLSTWIFDRKIPYLGVAFDALILSFLHSCPML